MTLDLCGYEAKARQATEHFWRSRDKALAKKKETGTTDAGTRGAVTGGKNMAGFEDLICEVMRANGPSDLRIIAGSKTNLPGYFRATKNWDVIAIRDGRLVAAIEAKSQVGSFGNNQNNRIEEVIGSGQDFWTAYRESGFGKDAPRPMLAWLMLVEDCPDTLKPVKPRDDHFKSYPEFESASYVERYQILCRKLTEERLYDAACLLHSASTAVHGGEYRDLDDVSGLRNFVATLAAHVAKEAAI